jgi:hypothetical protein
MITTKTYHQLYNKELEARISAVSKSIIELEKNNLTVKEYLLPYSIYIKQNFKFTLEEILQLPDITDFLKSIKKINPIIEVYFQTLAAYCLT